MSKSSPALAGEGNRAARGVVEGEQRDAAEAYRTIEPPPVRPLSEILAELETLDEDFGPIDDPAPRR